MPVSTPTASTAEASAMPLASLRVAEHTVEVVSDSGEGAQKCGQLFGRISARMGNGVWTVEIIPAEIQPPARTPSSASGNRIRIGTEPVTNWGDAADLVVAFNEQVLLARHRLGALEPGAIILLENFWADHADPAIRTAWQEAMRELEGHDYRIVPVPMEAQCLTVVDNARKGKNMFALGMLCEIYGRETAIAHELIAEVFAKKSDEVRDANIALFDLGHGWAAKHVPFHIEVPTRRDDRPMVVMNGNQAVALGAVAAGFEVCAMYPITPATSVSHYLAEIFERFGGVVHQAEDEIAACGVAIGSSYAGKTAFTVTSGPGLALKTEFLGLAVMTETPLVLVDVQRGGPSTGLPTKVEQSDLLAAVFGQPGDAPHVVIAPATIEECFTVMPTARRLAETFRTLVMVLTDANLATGVQPIPRPAVDVRWQGEPPSLAPVRPGQRPYEWDPETGLSARHIPGQPDGMHTVTGLAHDEQSKVAYHPDVNVRGAQARSRKLAVLERMLAPPAVYGDAEGDLLVVGWGSTKGAIEEAVDRACADGARVSSLHLRFLSPLEPGLAEIFARFARVMTVEINYSDDPHDAVITGVNRRYGQLAWLLRARTLRDVDCWTRVPGEPLRPGHILDALRDRLPGGGS